jgi:hypothetical protein
MSKKATKKTEPRKTSPPARRNEAEEASPEITSESVKVRRAPSLEQIRDRAYQIFRTGANPRDPVADWLQAERELSGEPRA